MKLSSFLSPLKLSFFFSQRIANSKSSQNNISSPAVKIGMTAVTLGVVVMILTLAVIRGFKHQITLKLKSLSSDIVVMPYQTDYDITSRPLSVVQDTLNKLKKLPFLSQIEPVCIKNGILKIKEENEGVVFKGVTHQYDWNILKTYLVAGKFPIYTDTAISKEIVISKKLADKMQIQLNQKIIVYFIIKTKDEFENEKIDYRSRDFYVTGIIHPQMGELDNQLIFGDAKVIQKINNWQTNEYSQIEIYAKPNVSGDMIIQNIIDFFPYNYKLVLAEELYASIFNWLEMIDINAVIIIVLMMIVAAVNMVSALIILILEKVTFIGILKALGMSDFSVKNIFLFVSIKILGWGLLTGNVIALTLLYLQSQYHFLSLNPESYYVDYIPVEWNFYDWLLLNAGVVTNCLFFMFLPTFIISKMSPAQILRWE